eukprot:CAMPEP_0175456118 /NCGR_PEP_ID=MMETSP0095-20121207/65375_1 /TAXON_ID=311494 /ORGANISM="Alexandrium monilatum, Strain CCMP3105" /LENGTH=50 /DNA_ID=CAMNT_0016756921 /DNA_START=30 /DNA_END=179 /DNA_ORIENTATION=-
MHKQTHAPAPLPMLPPTSAPSWGGAAVSPATPLALGKALLNSARRTPRRE